ncbi:MAG: hypothetical protein Q8S84_03055 [bacterium]|nr:hypothetical protein [bacterium]MDP3380510.1 hypothetical protein [bacterium]
MFASTSHIVFTLFQAGIIRFFTASFTFIFAVNSSLNHISLSVLLNILAQILDISQSIKISGVLSSIMTFFLTSSCESAYQNILSFEFDTTITLKFVRLSGKSKLTFAFQLSSVITLGL